MAKQTKLWNHEEIEVIYSKKAMNIIYSECMTTILRKKSEVSHRHYKVIQILGLSPTQKAVSVTRFDHVMGWKVQWAYLTDLIYCSTKSSDSGISNFTYHQHTDRNESEKTAARTEDKEKQRNKTNQASSFETSHFDPSSVTRSTSSSF